jgi:acetyl-CoA acetyltransferase
MQALDMIALPALLKPNHSCGKRDVLSDSLHEWWTPGHFSRGMLNAVTARAACRVPARCASGRRYANRWARSHSEQRHTLTAGNSSPLTDGAARPWVASKAGLARLAAAIRKAKLVDWEIAAIDLRTEGLLMAPAFAIPRLLAWQGLTYADMDIWEIHEAFAAQVLAHVKALESPDFLRTRRGSITPSAPSRARE